MDKFFNWWWEGILGLDWVGRIIMILIVGISLYLLIANAKELRKKSPILLTALVLGFILLIIFGKYVVFLIELLLSLVIALLTIFDSIMSFLAGEPR